LNDIRQGNLDPARSKIEDLTRYLLDGMVVRPEVKANKEILAGRLSSENLKILVLDMTPFLPNVITYSRFLADRLRAELLLKEGSAMEAIDLCNKMTMPWTPPINLAYDTIRYNLDVPRGLRAQAYEKAGNVDEAIAEYERILTFNPENPDRRLTDPLCHYRLAKLYEKKGEQKKARARYERFLELWKDADPGQLEVEDAKARLTALK
jgi:tetratricopeptide (TPR) repeat protein